MEAIEAIITRAASDPDFLQRFVADPIAVARDEGFQIPAVSKEEMIAVLLGAGAGGQQIAELLQDRISHMGLAGGLMQGLMREPIVGNPMESAIKIDGGPNIGANAVKF